MPDIGLFSPPWWVVLLYVCVLGHVTNACITLYLHRGMTHGGVTFHPVVAHFMRFWLWLTTGTNTREWVAIHRKHHAYSDREGDPHSPQIAGFWGIVLGGVFHYQRATKDTEMIEKYGKGCPDDLIERKLYARYGGFGLLTMLVVDILLFGPLFGLLAWVGMIIWFPILGNVINGIGHAIGYRNFGTKDHSRNIVPLGLVVVGEELHNNHHADPRSAKFKAKWWEFDIGWTYIKMLSFARLADIVYARSASAKEFARKYYADGKDVVGGAVSGAKETLAKRYDEAEAYYAEKKEAAEAYYSERKEAAEAYYAERKAAAERTLREARADAARMREQLAEEVERRSPSPAEPEGA